MNEHSSVCQKIVHSCINIVNGTLKCFVNDSLFIDVSGSGKCECKINVSKFM